MPEKPFGSCSKNNVVTATVLPLNTPTLVAGATSGIYLNQFTHNGAGRLTYTGTNPIYVEIVRTSNIYTVAGVNQIIRTQFYKMALSLEFQQRRIKLQLELVVFNQEQRLQ